MPDNPSKHESDAAISSTYGPGNGPNATADGKTVASQNQLVEILDQYLARLKSGEAPSKEELVACYPHLASQLEACLAGLEFIHRAESSGAASPQRLGDFLLLREVGRGGMGAVFEAEQVSLHRRVAVKVLRFGTVSDPEAVDRFRREAETVAHLHHTNIVPIFFVGSEKGISYYAMEFIDGRSLAEVLAERGTPVEPITVVDWGYQAAEALAHAHQRGVIHRDIKPSNLLLDDENRIWLTDFGLAKRLDDVTLSMTGALLGTPRYMSPEQASAARHRLDHRTDIYSLGATLYELATGQPVFQAETPHQLIQQILSQEPTPPRQLSASLPRDVETILLKCLSKEPNQRYASARALADDLRTVLDGRPIQAQRARLTERGMKWARRHHRSLKLTGASVGATLALVLLVLLSSLWYARRQVVPLSLATDQGPLAAELRDDDGRLASHQTVPTQEAVKLRAGSYRMQVTGKGRLSETYEVRLQRGQYPKFDLNLDESLLGSPLRLARAGQVVSTDDGALVFDLDDNDIRCWDMQRVALRWTMPLRDSAHPLLNKETGWIWPWHRLQNSSVYSGWGAFDLRPFVVSPAVDLSGDGVADVILACRHQACLLALSGHNGDLLWVAARGRDLSSAIVNPSVRYDQHGVVSGVVAAPTPSIDADADGVIDWLVSIADRHVADNSVNRWIELISGRTGQTLWRRELEDRWFAATPDLSVPECFRWFKGSGTATSQIGGSALFNIGPIAKRDTGHIERVGYFHEVPSRPMMVSSQAGRTGPACVALLAGSHILLFDAATGTPIGPGIECGLHPGREPIVSDVDGNGADELVLMQELAPQVGAGGPAATSAVQIGVFSLAHQRLQWSRKIQAEWPRADWPLFPTAAPNGPS